MASDAADSGQSWLCIAERAFIPMSLLLVVLSFSSFTGASCLSGVMVDVEVERPLPPIPFRGPKWVSLNS